MLFTSKARLQGYTAVSKYSNIIMIIPVGSLMLVKGRCLAVTAQRMVTKYKSFSMLYRALKTFKNANRQALIPMHTRFIEK